MQSRITCPIWLGRSKSSALDLPLAGGDVGAAVLGSILSVILVFDGVACALFDGSIGTDRLPGERNDKEPFDEEKTGWGWRIVTKLDAANTILPTTYKMDRRS